MANNTKYKEGLQRIIALSSKSEGYVSSGITLKDLRNVPEDVKKHFRHKAYECDYGELEGD